MAAVAMYGVVHHWVLLHPPAAHLGVCPSWRFLSACEEASHHDCGGTEGERLDDVPAVADASIGNDRNVTHLVGRARSLEHGRGLEDGRTDGRKDGKQGISGQREGKASELGDSQWGTRLKGPSAGLIAAGGDDSVASCPASWI